MNFSKSVIHLANMFLSLYYVPGTMLDTADIISSMQNIQATTFIGLTVQWERQAVSGYRTMWYHRESGEIFYSLSWGGAEERPEGDLDVNLGKVGWDGMESKEPSSKWKEM